MAVFFKKKVASAVVKAEPPELTQRELDTLEAVGLAPEKPKPAKRVLVLNKRKYAPIGVGDTVRLLNPVPWNPKYVEGEAAEVVACWGIKSSDAAVADLDPTEWALFEVSRVNGERALIRRFNLDLVSHVTKVSQPVEEAATC